MLILKLTETVCKSLSKVVLCLFGSLFRKLWLKLISKSYIIRFVYIAALLYCVYFLTSKRQWFNDDIHAQWLKDDISAGYYSKKQWFNDDIFAGYYSKKRWFNDDIYVQWFNDDIYVGYHSFHITLFAIAFVVDMYIARITQVALEVCHHVHNFGWKRCLLFVFTVSALSFLLVGMADTVTSVVRDVSKDEIVRRFEDNIHRIEEDREYFKLTTIHPVTKGEHNPKLFHKIFRYSMEDVQMECVHRMPWFSAARPFTEQIVWRRNGVPLIQTDRHHIKIDFREVPEDNSLLDSMLRKYGISEYEVNSTLTIHLLKDSEFGSYTCHVAKFARNSVRDYIRMMKKLNKEESRNAAWEPKPVEPDSPTCSNAVEPRVQWKDVYTWVDEFRLIKLSRRLEPIRVAPGAILAFTTSYWHMSRKEDVEVDYSVNRQSFHQLCPGPFHGCSMLLSLYWFIGHDIGWRFGFPPLHLFSTWKVPAERYHLYHCLCEHSFGFHTVRYLRKYYNRTVNRYEMIEILHPHKLLVIPKDQQMLDLFVNQSTPSPTISPECCTRDKASCGDFFVAELAGLATKLFHWKELYFIAVGCLVCICVAYKFKSFLTQLGRITRRLTLEGSMGFFSTAVITFEPTRSDRNPADINISYDVFLSYSDEDTAIVNGTVVPFLESQGLKVFVRDRDGHPGMTELGVLKQALENSQRFLIFLSRAYFGDRFRNDFEAAMILETLCDRSPYPNEVLLIKLDQCEIPVWLKQFQVHDWTASNLATEDHQHNLLKWLEPAERKGTFRSALDVLVSFLLIALVTSVLLTAAFRNTYYLAQ